MQKKPFVLSAKVIIRDDRDRCLLLKRSPASRNNGGLWDLPGGKVDAGEQFEDALLREVHEEAALTIELEHVIGAAEAELDDRKVAYLLLSGRLVSGEVHLSDEHDEFVWVERGKLGDAHVCPQFQPFLEAWAQAGAH